jgi:glucosamine--fructose-6-phosphate aminotransferase (isomerizing)
MCGIIGYVGTRDVVPVLLGGLKKLEYRGYDSAGIAVIDNGEVEIVRAEGKLSNLENKLQEHTLHGTFGMGHTRWATHGKPNENNAHPHRDCTGKVVVIHNGIIENFLPLKQQLQAAGHQFRTETDTEVVAHLIEELMKDGTTFIEAVRKTLKQLEGHYALVMIHGDQPGTIVAAKHGPPLVVGLGEGENIVASDVAPLLAYTRNIIYLEDGEYAIVDRDKVEVFSVKDDALIDREAKRILWDAVMAEKEGYRHYMLKEIHEQPRAVRDTFTGRMFEESAEIFFNDLQITPEEWANVRRVHVIACGTSWHAGLVGKFLLESAARIPVEVDYGSEYRYRNPIVDEHTLVIGVTQSGETADTIAGMQEAKAKGAKLITICNVIGAAATRMSDGVIYTNAGPEIGVASTKAFTTQLVAFYLLALYIRQLRGDDKDEIRAAMRELSTIPQKIERLLKQEKHIEALAHKYSKAQDFLFLGRSVHYPIALEGALKLKEISYIHAEGYPAGEMKHGPIALIDENLPIVAIAMSSPVYEKVVSNLQEVKARDGKLIVICDEGDTAMKNFADDIIEVPKTIEGLQPILSVIPTQLLAYYIALRRGCDVDQPRNLAKSVTVE